ncbi:SFL1 [[Candida] subhashii]|uniref:SFL1 n=1 Tax=[Candida] subhashii TaxID=561895 RepID=A0A8J5UK23_9ASCO|nr:SFL1 [[Candida] subhashii]KAG7661591.1 SFL1 [[Candida] subhashii]
MAEPPTLRPTSSFAIPPISTETSTTVSMSTSSAVDATPMGCSASSASNGNSTNSSNNNNNAGKTQIVFIHKLYDMLHDDTISHLIWWSPTLDSFYVMPGEEFSKALAQYFKHTNIASFIRQLNMYGFHKVNETFQNQDEQANNQQQPNKWEFRHSTSQFRKGDVESLKSIKRRSSKNINSQREVVSIKSLPPTSHPIEYTQQPPPPNYPHPHQHHVHPPIQPHPQQMYQPPPDDGSMREAQTFQPPLAQVMSYSNANQSNPNSPSSPAPHGPGAVPPGHIEYTTRPPPPTSFENGVNFKLMEMSSQINSLRNDLSIMNRQCDMLYQNLKSQANDSVTILDMFESWIRSEYNDTSAIPERTGENKTPVNSIKAEDAPSPMSRLDKPKFITEIRHLKHAMSQRINQPIVTSLQAQPEQGVSQSFATNSRNPSNSSIQIIPQPYPLNPHYTIYDRASEENDPTKRNLSVYDPLQPIPSRHNSRALIDDPSSIGLQGRIRTESKSYSPLSINGMKQIQQQKTSSPISLIPSSQQQQQQNSSNSSSSRSSIESKRILPHVSTDFVQPSIPYTTTPLSGSRTNSLPNPRTEKIGAGSTYFYQRNSFTSMNDQKLNPSSRPQSQQSPISGIPRRGSPPRSVPDQLPSVSELDKSIKSGGVGLPALFTKRNDENENKKRKLD